MNRNVGIQSAIGVLIICVILFPAAVFSSFRLGVIAIFLILLFALSIRLFLGSVVAMSRSESPPIPDECSLPEVTIIIPIYNEARLLPTTLDSFRDIDYPKNRLKIILSYERDCTDKSPKIAQDASNESPVFEAVEHDSGLQGKMANVNSALDYTDSEIVGIVDADQRFESDALKRAVAWFESDDNLLCLRGQTYAFNPLESVLALHASVERDIAELADIYARDILGGFQLYGGGHVFFRSTTFDMLGNFDETILIDDVEMSSRLQFSGSKIRIDPNIVSYGENPASFKEWCQQRSRWYRGWIQVSRKYCKSIIRMENTSLKKSADGAFTLGYWLGPVYLIAAFPAVAYSLIIPNQIQFSPAEIGLLGTALFILPAATIFLLYHGKGSDQKMHTKYKYLISLTLWPYLFVQMAVAYASFIKYITKHVIEN